MSIKHSVYWQLDARTVCSVRLYGEDRPIEEAIHVRQGYHAPILAQQAGCDTPCSGTIITTSNRRSGAAAGWCCSRLQEEVCKLPSQFMMIACTCSSMTPQHHRLYCICQTMLVHATADDWKSQVDIGCTLSCATFGCTGRVNDKRQGISRYLLICLRALDPPAISFVTGLAMPSAMSCACVSASSKSSPPAQPQPRKQPKATPQSANHPDVRLLLWWKVPELGS